MNRADALRQMRELRPVFVREQPHEAERMADALHMWANDRAGRLALSMTMSARVPSVWRLRREYVKAQQQLASATH